MRPMIRTDIHAINAIDAEQLAADREWDHTDLSAGPDRARRHRARDHPRDRPVAGVAVGADRDVADEPPAGLDADLEPYAGLGESHVAHLGDERPGAVRGSMASPMTGSGPAPGCTEPGSA